MGTNRIDLISDGLSLSPPPPPPSRLLLFALFLPVLFFAGWSLQTIATDRGGCNNLFYDLCLNWREKLLFSTTSFPSLSHQFYRPDLIRWWYVAFEQFWVGKIIGCILLQITYKTWGRVARTCQSYRVRMYLDTVHVWISIYLGSHIQTNLYSKEKWL